jgi:hypothetical protein
MIGGDGRVMRNMPIMILFNLAWLFLYPLIAGAPFVKVILPTIISLPLFIYLHLCSYYYGGPNEIRGRYITGVFLLGLALTFFNLAAVCYLIFGSFSFAFAVPTRVASDIRCQRRIRHRDHPAR